MGDFISSLEEPKEIFWYEIQYEGKGCGSEYSELRSRNYFSGKHNGTSSVSVNRDCNTKKDAATTFMIPSVEHINNFEMKLEQDVHPCYGKFNRKVKIKKLPYGLDRGDGSLTCESAQNLFPQAFLDSEQFDQKLEIHSNKTWWNLSQEGTLFGGTTNFKSSFNIAYDTYEDAMSGTALPNHSSEWSIRIYSFDEGYGVWDEYVLATMGEFYKFILDNYGSYKESRFECSRYEHAAEKGEIRVNRK